MDIELEILTFSIIFLVLLIIMTFYNRRHNTFDVIKPRTEVMFLVSKFKLDLNKVNYIKLLHVFAFINAFIISFSVSVVSNIENLILMMVVGFISVFGLIILMYSLLGYIYKMKGMTK